MIELDPHDDFDALLIRIKTLHNKKRADYSDPNNRFSNFEFAAQFSGVTVKQTFDVMIGIKQARLLQLFQEGRIAQNESKEDSLLDRTIYCMLDLLYYIQEERREKPYKELER